MDPIHQFEIKNLLPIIRIGGTEIAFTNSALFMLIALALILALMLGATRSRALVPGRLQATAEMVYEFVADSLRSSAGQEGMKFFPLVFSIFVFILVLIALAILGKYIRLWIQSVWSSAGIGIFDLLGMTFRKVDPKVIVRSKIMAVQSGLG